MNWSRAAPPPRNCAPRRWPKNFRPLAEEGVARVLDGTTSLAEVSRAVDLTGRFI